MKIVVCVKQVPASIEVKLDPVTSTIMRESAASILNPFDEFAIEEAVKLKTKFGGHIHAISMGIPSAVAILRDALALGADSASLLSDRKFAGSDTLATGYALSSSIKTVPDLDLIICGQVATDGDTAQVPPIVAQYLGIPCITNVSEIISISDGQITCKRIDDEYYSIWQAKLPALITVTKECNIPRLPSIQSAIRSMNQFVDTFTALDLAPIDIGQLGLKGSPTQVKKTFVPNRRKTFEIISGDKNEQVHRLVEIVSSITGGQAGGYNDRN